MKIGIDIDGVIYNSEKYFNDYATQYCYNLYKKGELSTIYNNNGKLLGPIHKKDISCKNI